MIFCVLNPEKIWHQWLLHFPTSPVYCIHFTLGNPKKSFFNNIFHTCMYFGPRIIFVISEGNKLLFPYPLHLKNVTALPCKMYNFFHLTEGMLHYVACWIIFVIAEENKLFFPYPPHLKNVTTLPCKMHNFFHLTEGMLHSSKRWWLWKKAGSGLALVALKRTGCDMWQMECQASNVTANVQVDHLLHRYMFPVFFATDQLHRPPSCVKIQPMSQRFRNSSVSPIGW